MKYFLVNLTDMGFGGWKLQNAHQKKWKKK
jgi:hypothetical protein